MLRLEGVKGNAKVRPLERGHIETSMLDGTILPATYGIKFIRSSRTVKRLTLPVKSTWTYNALTGKWD